MVQVLHKMGEMGSLDLMGVKVPIEFDEMSKGGVILANRGGTL